jgi:taurine dioxygenase
MPEGSPVLEGQREGFVLDFERRKPPTDGWHSDLTLTARPPTGTVLLGRVIPVGGDTLFANQYLAYESLSDGMKAMLHGLRAVHTGRYWAKDGAHLRGGRAPSQRRSFRPHPSRDRPQGAVRQCRLHLALRGDDVRGNSPAAGMAVQPQRAAELHFRHRWSEGDLRMWDDRCLQHCAVADHGAARRVVHCVVIVGDEPR